MAHSTEGASAYSPPPAYFPLSLYLVLHLPTNSYGCVHVGGLRGLACFSTPQTALEFAARMSTQNNLVVEMTMADACEVAAGSLPRVPALVLADDADSPVISHLVAADSCP